MSDDEATDDSNVAQQENMSSGLSIKGKNKFGDSTRDQCELYIKGKGKTAEEAIEEFEKALEAAEGGNWNHRLLEMNPERDSEEESDDE